MDFDQTHMATSFGQGNKKLGFGDLDPISWSHGTYM